MKLSDEELAAIKTRAFNSGNMQQSVALTDRDKLLSHIDAIAPELSQARVDAEAASDVLDGNPFAAGDKLAERISNALAAADAAVRTCNEMLEKAQAERDETQASYIAGLEVQRDQLQRIEALTAELAAMRAGAPDGWRMVPIHWCRDITDAARDAADACNDGDQEALKTACQRLDDLQSDELDWLTREPAAPQPPAQPVAVEVKPLSFRKLMSRWQSLASTAFGSYLISYGSSGEKATLFVPANDKPMLFAASDPLAETPERQAEAAATAHYRAAILSAINARPEAAVKAEALREAIHLIQEDADCDTANRAYSDGFKAGIAHAVDVIDANADRLEKEGN